MNGLDKILKDDVEWWGNHSSLRFQIEADVDQKECIKKNALDIESSLGIKLPDSASVVKIGNLEHLCLDCYIIWPCVSDEDKTLFKSVGASITSIGEVRKITTKSKP